MLRSIPAEGIFDMNKALNSNDPWHTGWRKCVKPTGSIY